MSEIKIEAPETQDPILEQAMSMGYNPDKESFLAKGGKETDWVDAKTFVDRAPFIKQINTLKSKMDKMCDFVDRLEKSNHEAQAKAYERAYNELKSQMKQATEIGDVNAVEVLTEKVVAAKQAMDTAKQTQDDNPEMTKAANEFLKNNRSWWDQKTTTSAAMRQFAGSREEKYLRMGMSPSEMYARIEADMHDEYPEIIGPNKTSPKDNSISPRESSSVLKGTGSLSGLSKEVKDIYYTIKDYREKNGQKFTPDDFFKMHPDLKNLKSE